MEIRLYTFFRILLFILFLSYGIDSYAQTRKADIIIRRDSTRIEALILEVNETLIKYKKHSDQEGPTFSLGKKEIASIHYGNGEIENFPAVAEIYFDEGPKPVEQYQPPVQSYPAERPSTGLQRGTLSSLSNQQLQQNYKLYLKKNSSYKTMAAVGVAMLAGLTTVGIITISAAERDYNSSSGRISQRQYENRVVGGAYLIVGGIFGGTPLTIIGLVKKNSYKKKAAAVQKELGRRNEPISFGISPGFDVRNRAAMATLRVSF